ncbi:hypothetical protein N9N32_00030 [Alphaproteobacteria bacterium]|nr:hypothetical protein [Alphaproteobacteria bacterium]
MITITFASLELSSTVTRYTVIDGGFPLDYDGNTYLNDGLVVALDKTVISAELANVTQNITLFLDNDVKNAIQTDTYRNRRAKLFKGEWDPSTSTLSSVRSIYEGLIDTHNTPSEDGTVEFIVASLISPLRRPSDNISLQVLHNQRLEDGVYGSANTNTIDTFLRNAGSSFQDFTLGASEYREAVTKPMYIKIQKNMFGNHKRKYVGEELVSAEIQETPGSQLENPASFQPARVYGVSGVNAAIVAAWNHDTTNDFAQTKSYYGTNWRGFQDEEAANAIRPDTRFGTIVYLVHAGEVQNLNIYIDGLNGEVQSRSLSLTAGTSSVQYLKDEYEDENEVTQNNVYAAVEVLWGSNNQQPPTSWINTSDGEIDANFRGIGYVLVGITFEATRDGAIARGMPEVGFQVKQTNSLSMSIPAWSETAIASQTGFSYDNSSPYSANSFYVENFALWFSSSRKRALTTNQSFKSAFNGGFLRFVPSATFAADLDTSYGLSSSTTSVYNFADGVSDIQITQGSNYGKFKVVSASRNTAGTEYTLWLSGDKGNSGTIDITQTFDFDIEETTRTGNITALTSRVPNQHPARVIVDYLMDKQVGPGLSADDIDLESFLLCQENAAKIPQYINGVMQGKDTFVEYLQDVADTANLTLYQEGDKIKCRFRKPIQASDVAVTFTEDNCSDMNLINFRNEDKFNEFILTVDLQRTSNVKAPRITSIPVETRDIGYLSEDNGLRSIGEFTSEWLTLFYSETIDEDGNATTTLDETESSEYLESYEQYARFLMDISRFYEEVELTTTYSIAKDFTIGTVFDVENDLYGFIGNNIRRYEVVDYADNHDGTVSLVGQRHSNAIFGLEDDFSNNVFDSLEPTVLPYISNSQTAIPSAPDLTAVWEPNSRRIDLSWTEPSINLFNASHYQVQEKANGETDWTTISEQLVTSDRVFSRAIVERGGIYKYRVRALTPNGMVNGPFSTTQYVRLDLAFGDNKPEQQKIIITGNRSNASVASAVDTTVTIGLPTNFEAAPADTSGTGATSNLGNLGVDLDVTSNFVATASDSETSSNVGLTTSTTNLPGTPSGGSYSVVDTYQSSVTGTASATDATSTTGTFNLTNNAGTIDITSNFLPTESGVFPASGTSTATGTNNLTNSAGSVTVSSDFAGGGDGSLTGNTTGTFTLPDSAGTLTVASDYYSASSGAFRSDIGAEVTFYWESTNPTFSGTSTSSGGTNYTWEAGFYTGTLNWNSDTISLLKPSSVPSNFWDVQTENSGSGKSLPGSGLADGYYAYYVITKKTSDPSFSHNVILAVVQVKSGVVANIGSRKYINVASVNLPYGRSFSNVPTWSMSTTGNVSTTRTGLQSASSSSPIEITQRIGVDADWYQTGRSTTTTSLTQASVTGTASATVNITSTGIAGPFTYYKTHPTTSNSLSVGAVSYSVSNGPGGSLQVTPIGPFTGGDRARVILGSPSTFYLSQSQLPYVGTVSVSIEGLLTEVSVSGGVVDTANQYTGGAHAINDKGVGALPATSRTEQGSTTYTLTRSLGFTLGNGLIIDGTSQTDTYVDNLQPLKNWEVDIQAVSSGSTTYSLNRATNFTQGNGLVVDGVVRGNSFTQNAGIKPYSVTASRPQSGSTVYTFTPDAAFNDPTTSFSVGAVTRTSPYPETAPPREYFATATRPESGNTTYTLNRATGFTNGQGWTIGGTPESTDTVIKVANAESWSIAVSRPQSGGTTYELAGGPANLGIDLTVDGQVLTESSRLHTFTDADINRAWSATFDATTFSLEVDPNDVVYVGNSYEIISQAITKGADEDDTLTEIANAVTAMHTDITWDSTISTNSISGNREITIDLGTTSNIGFDIALGGKNSKNPSITDIETLGAGVNFSSYTLTSPDGGSTLNFNGFTIDATVSDRNTVINEAVRQVDVNAEAPKDFLAESDGNSLIFTARTTGTSAGQWNFAWNHGSSTGNLRAKTYETDSDSTSSADNIDAEVVREGVADGSVNNTSFPSGTTSTTYTDAVRDERNFFAERAVIWAEGNTEPSVSTTTTDYTWREVLASG